MNVIDEFVHLLGDRRSWSLHSLSEMLGMNLDRVLKIAIFLSEYGFVKFDPVRGVVRAASDFPFEDASTSYDEGLECIFKSLKGFRFCRMIGGRGNFNISLAAVEFIFEKSRAESLRKPIRIFGRLIPSWFVALLVIMILMLGGSLATMG